MSATYSVDLVILLPPAAHVVTVLHPSEYAWHSCSASRSTSLLPGCGKHNIIVV